MSCPPATYLRLAAGSSPPTTGRLLLAAADTSRRPPTSRPKRLASYQPPAAGNRLLFCFKEKASQTDKHTNLGNPRTRPACTTAKGCRLDSATTSPPPTTCARTTKTSKTRRAHGKTHCLGAGQQTGELGDENRPRKNRPRARNLCNAPPVRDERDRATHGVVPDGSRRCVCVVEREAVQQREPVPQAVHAGLRHTGRDASKTDNTANKVVRRVTAANRTMSEAACACTRTEPTSGRRAIADDTQGGEGDSKRGAT